MVQAAIAELEAREGRSGSESMVGEDEGDALCLCLDEEADDGRESLLLFCSLELLDDEKMALNMMAAASSRRGVGKYGGVTGRNVSGGGEVERWERRQEARGASRAQEHQCRFTAASRHSTLSARGRAHIWLHGMSPFPPKSAPRRVLANSSTTSKVEAGPKKSNSMWTAKC